MRERCKKKDQNRSYLIIVSIDIIIIWFQLLLSLHHLGPALMLKSNFSDLLVDDAAAVG